MTFPSTFLFLGHFLQISVTGIKIKRILKYFQMTQKSACESDVEYIFVENKWLATVTYMVGCGGGV